MANGAHLNAIPKYNRPIRNTIILGAALFFGIGAFPAYSATITYTEDMTDFPNPERGFWGGTVSKKYISISNSGVLSQSYLDGVEKIFTDTRAAKKKVVPRFQYSGGDPVLPTLLAHLDQLKPIFQRNYDVIALLEAGFIGDYGEWHSSSHFKENDSVGRRQVLLKLLDVLPKERMVALRYNWDKRAIFSSNAPIALNEAFNGSNKSRTGATNDCFVTNEHDAGTYHIPPWEYNALGIEKEKDYLSADNLFVPQDGETCQVGSVSYASCDRALADMKRMRWDMLRTGWYTPVLNQWKSQGCWDTMSKSLGYRIVLISGTFDDDVTDGVLDATLRLKNVGFGKMFNPRNLEMVLRNGSNEYKLPMPQDPRFWSPGQEQTLTIKIPIPTSVPFGNYSLFLNLADPAPKLYGIPEYSVRLANQTVWEANTGYNSLKTSVKVSSHASPNSVSLMSMEPKRKIGINLLDETSGNSSVKISYMNSQPAQVRIDIYDLSGKLVTGLVNEYLGTGMHNFTWDLLDHAGQVQPAGVYFVSFYSEGLLETRRLILKGSR